MNRLKDLRNSSGLTLKQLGEAVSDNPANLNRYENFLTEPKLRTWEKSANYFDVDPEYLVGWSDVRKR